MVVGGGVLSAVFEDAGATNRDFLGFFLAASERSSTSKAFLFRVWGGVVDN